MVRPDEKNENDARDDDAGGDDDIQTTVRLVLAAQSGDRDALEQLFKRHAPHAQRRAALRFGWTLHEFEDYEDMAQDALLRALKGLGRFDPEREGSSVGAFRAWLATCVQTAIYDHFKRVKAQKRPPLVRAPDLKGAAGREGELPTSHFLPADKGPSPSAIVSADELQEKLEQAISSMKPEYQDVLVLKQHRGLSDLEICHQLKLNSEDTVRVVLHRARKKLKRELAEWL